MRVTEVVIRKLMHVGNKRAIVSITLDNAITIHDLQVVETDHFFVGFPNRKDENGKHRDIVHPINKHTRMIVEGAILQAYSKLVNSGRKA